MGFLAGRVAIVTGAGRGLGRAHALELARLGAHVVVNDLGVERDGAGAASSAPADLVVAEIRDGGGVALANGDDVADWEGARRMVTAAIQAWGRLDVLVCNAGFLRDRMFVSSEEGEWDDVLRVHVKGHVAPARHAAAHWRDAAKRGEAVDARIVNTTSGAGLQGSIGQAAYAAAKGAIASLTLVQAAELGRYGVTANAIAPAARTRMTEAAFAAMMKRPESGFDAMAPDNVSPLVAWLASAESRAITGRVFDVQGGKITVEDGWRPGPSVDHGARWDPRKLGDVVRDLVATAPVPAAVWGAS
ncbi:MAG: SDR family NAD(P)-dependent oxidoreductase [Myxococcales bacterium]|nr:SDR family NAD(P)-dependent oxidoreductase [Myxococcales bacterium]